MKFLKRWLSDAQLARPARSPRPARLRPLGIEHLEDRTVPAIALPDVPVAQGMVQSSNPTGIAGGVAPELIQNPIRLSQVLAVSSTGGGIAFTVSNNLGGAWGARASGIGLRTDPLLVGAGGGTYTIAEAPSIAFDRADTFYLAHIQRNADNTSGVLLADKFTIDSNGNIANLNQQRVLYRWVNQDPVFNPSVGVHSDTASATDVDTGAVQQNPNTGRGVYIAWNTDATQRTIAGSITTAAVFMAVSDDGGLSYSDPVGVNGGATGNGHEGATGMNPEVQFVASKVGTTAGFSGGTPGGNLAVFYNTGSGVVADVSNPFNPATGGQLPANPLSVQTTVAGQTGAITGASTPPNGVLTEATTDFTLDVDLTTVAGFDLLRDMSLTLGVYSQGLERMRIQLIPPAASNLPTITLLESRQLLLPDGSLQDRFLNSGSVYTSGVLNGSRPGLAGGNPSSLGIIRSGTTTLDGTSYGLVFDQQAARYINDPANLAPLILRVRPEDNTFDGNARLGLSKYNGFSAALLSGTWTLRVTNYKEDDTGTPPPPGPMVTKFEMKFVSRVNTVGFDGNPAAAGGTSAATPNLTGAGTAALPLVAQGTQQVGGLQGWYSVAVDTTKGSFSPFQGRMYVATSNGTSINVLFSNDGGESWQAGGQVNDQGPNDGVSNGGRSRFQPTITVDQTTGTVVVMWYDARWDASDARVATFIATSVDGGQTWSPNTFLNETKSARDAITRDLVNIEPVPNNLSAVGVFGGEQGLVAYNGTVVPVWTGNVNGGGGGLMTATTRIAAGPRILQGDMGPVSDSFDTAGGTTISYNNTFTLDGTRQLDAFYVRFDRRIDPTTFTVADVQLRYQDTTGAAAQDISGQVLSVQALNPSQTGVVYQYDGTAATGTTAASSVVVPAVGDDDIQDIRVRVSLSGGNAQNLTLRLLGPNGQNVRLANLNGGGVAVATAFASTTFDPNGTAIGIATPPYGTVDAFDAGLFAALIGDDATGTWTLQATNNLGQVVTINSWSLELTLADNSATRFLVRLAPQSRVGTYSYAVGPNIGDRIRESVAGNLAPLTNTPNVTVTDLQTPYGITVTGLGNKNGVTANVQLGPTNALARNLVLRLINDNGRSILLTLGNGGVDGSSNPINAGVAFANTTFSDAAAPMGANGPYGTVQPFESSLASLLGGGGGGGGGGANGNWFLQAIDLQTNTTIAVVGWSLTFTQNGGNPETFTAPVLLPSYSAPASVKGTSDIVVAGSPAVGNTANSVKVSVKINDAATNSGYAEDLVLRLTGPNGKSVYLTADRGEGGGGGGGGFGGNNSIRVGQRYGGTTFVDSGGSGGGFGGGQFGYIVPLESLQAAFGGANPNGTWTLEVVNAATAIINQQVLTPVATTTILDAWSLTLNNVVFHPTAMYPALIPGGGVFTDTVTGTPPANLSSIIVSLDLSEPVTTVANATDLRVELIGPNGQTVTLVNASGTGTAGASFDSTLFRDGAASIAGSTAPYTLVAPDIGSLLAAFGGPGGVGGVSGTWQLRVTNLSTGRTIQLDRWQLAFQGGAVGNLMDQDSDGTEAEVTDAFSNPTPTGGTPFVLPYAIDSLPLIIPGPRLVSSSPNLTADGSVSSIDLTFDKDMLASSFTPAQVLELRTPTGVTINGPFTVTPNPSGTPPVNANRVFRVTFPAQILSGHYSLLLGSGIKSATGLAMDPNMNAGVELVTGRVANPNAASVVSSDYNVGTTLNLAIPAAANGTTPSVTTHTISIADRYFITQQLAVPIQVRLDITDADARDLSVRLIAPDGTSIQLFTNVGGFGINGFTNFTGTQFSDFAGPNSQIQNAGAPFTGTFLPQQQLSVLNGKLSAGDWKLEITNRSTTNGGTLNFWGLSLPKPILGNGLGEPIIDQTTVGFRVFTSSPSQAISSTAWTPLGPTTAADVSGQRANGVVTVTAADPSDLSGNTVYAGGATGGLWKTTNFLTLDPAGPTWIPLLDAASAKAMRISSITILPRNNDPAQQSIVIVGTGDADARTAGVGFLRSVDGGRTFRLIDSTVNADPITSVILPVEDPGRDHIFSNNVSYVYKVVVDPVRLTNGEFVMYAAVGGDAPVAGLWRSITSGRTWFRIRAGECTDFVLGPNRVDLLDANGNPVQAVGGTGTPTLRLADIGYAAFAGANGGVYFAQSISTTSSLTLRTGGEGKPLFSGATVGNPGTNPGQNPDRIILAAVNATANTDPLAARVYQGYLYALVIGGGAPGLYMTKDFGSNWTRVDLDQSTNNETTAAYDYGTTAPPGISPPRFHALAADPTDPNVVYVGGVDGVFRVDVSTLDDAHAQVGGDNSRGGVGPQGEGASTGGLTSGPLRASFPYDGTGAHFNRLRDPIQPFITTGTQNVGGGQFINSGENAQMTQFQGLVGTNRIRNIETIFDPLTRKTRVLVSTDNGVYTAADRADTTRNQGIYAVAEVLTGVGSAVSVRGNRSSNLSMADVTQTAAQPSELAADLAGLYNGPQNSSAGQWIYSVSDRAYLNAPRGILRPSSAQYGQETYQAEVETQPYVNNPEAPGPVTFLEYTGYVQTDPQGSGTIYQYRPGTYANTMGGTGSDIFSVSLANGQAPIGRSNGLFANGFTEWNSLRTAYFAVNPADPLGVVISAPRGGRVYLTTDQGVNWFEAGAPGTFNNRQGTALAFGGRDPSNPTGDRNGFFYVGTSEGRIWVTLDAGSNWTEISAGLPGGPNAGPILKILANPRNGTYDAYALTATGVFYKADCRTAAAWVNITGNLFSITKPVFGEQVAAPILVAPNAANSRVGLTALQVDWRYAVPGQQVVLYAAGDTGVFRSIDGGTTWELFPANQSTTSLLDDGGYLPNARITDLNLVYGDLNSTGVPNQSNGRNILIASTYGRGLYAIRTDASTVPPGLGSTGPWVNTAPLTAPNANTGVASITLNFGDANNPIRVSKDTLNSSNMVLTGPGGVVVPYTVTDISGLSGGASLLNTFRLDFTPPTAGQYTLAMNLNVRDTSGRQLNQDKDGVNGENPQDFFIQQYTIGVNRPPTITGVPNQGLVVNTSSGPLSFTIGDPDAADVPGLVVTRATSDGVVLPTANIVIGGTGTARTVTVTPTGAGVATVTLTVTDAGGRFATTTFTVSSVAAASVPFTDTFTRADAPNLGGNWVVQTGTAEVSFQSTLATSPTVLATVNGVSQTNPIIQATVGLAAGSGASYATLVARFSGTGATATMYYAGLFLTNGQLTAQLYRQVNGTNTILAQTAIAGPVAPQYVLRFEVINDSLKLFVDGNLSLFAYDTAIPVAAGQTGFQYTVGNRLDTFSTDDLALLPVTLPAVPGQTATDTFTAANGIQLSRTWRDRLGNLSVTGNTAVGRSALNLSTYNIPATANVGAETTVAFTAVGQTVGIALRYSGPGATNMYWGTLSALAGGQQQAAIWRNVNGTWTQLAVANLNGSGGVLRFEANGPSLKLFVNGGRVLTAFDSTPSLATGGVGLLTGSGGSADNFYAFALGTTTTLPFTDPFNASAPLNQLGSVWTERAGAVTTAGNNARGTVAGANTATLNGVSAANVAVTATVQAQVGSPLTAILLLARYQANGDFYFGALNAYPAGGPNPNPYYLAEIWKATVSAGVTTYTPLLANAFPIAPASVVGQQIRFEVLGTSLRFYVNDTLRVFAQDTSITAAGSVGIRLGNGAGVDDFTAVVRAPQSPGLPFADNFNTTNAQSSLSTNWQERNGFFAVSAGTQRAVGGPSGTANLATVNGVNVANATIDGTFFFTAAGQTAQLVGRYTGGAGGTGDSNMYIAAFDTLAGGDAQVRILKNVNGAVTQLAAVTLTGYFPGANFAGTNPAFRFVLNGNNLTVFVGPNVGSLVQVLTTADTSLATGSVGIRAGAGAGIDNFNATSP